MSRYSLQGYLVALEVRTARTVMVEGVPDRTFVQHMLSALDTAGVASGEAFVVDMASIVEAGHGLGARESVEAVHNVAVTARPRFAGLVDREFRGFRCVPPITDQIGAHSVISDTLFWTRGHSIENYCLSKDAVWEFVQLQFPEFAVARTRGQLDRDFESLVRSAAIVSVAAYAAQVLNRSAGLPSAQLWNRAATEALEFDYEKFAAALTVRGASTDQSRAFSTKVAEITTDLSGAENAAMCRWLAHGRLGTQVIWAGVASILQESGAGADDVEQVASGFVDLKFKLAVTKWLATNVRNGAPVAGGEAPNELIAWFVAQSAAGRAI